MIYIEEIKEKKSQKELSVIGKKLLLKGLQTEYRFQDLPEIQLGEFGKPFFQNFPEIHFNISHCDKAVACIISDKPVGIDVEEIKPFDRDLAEYVCSPRELESILNSLNPSLAFTILWTKKESICKLSGQGLNTSKEIQTILDINFTQFTSIISESAGFVLSYCYNP